MVVSPLSLEYGVLWKPKGGHHPWHSKAGTSRHVPDRLEADPPSSPRSLVLLLQHLAGWCLAAAALSTLPLSVGENMVEETTENGSMFMPR